MRILLLVIATICCLAACRDGSPRARVQQEEGPPQRVVSIAPSLTEIAVDIGGAQQIVGISSYGRVPPGTEKAQRVGGFVDPSIEHIIALAPDLVIGVPLQQKALESCTSAGLLVLEVDCQTLDQALGAYETLGRTFGLSKEANRSKLELMEALAYVRARASSKQPKRTLLLLGQAGQDLQQVFPVSRGNFTNELLELAGGSNVLEGSVPSISTESVITLEPDVVIEIAMDETGDHGERILRPSPFWTRMASVPAVRSGQVHSVASSSLLQPGPAMAEGAALLYRLLHGSR